MKKLTITICCLFALHAFWCDFGEDRELLAFLVDLPEGVKDVDTYGINLCQFAAQWEADHER